MFSANISSDTYDHHALSQFFQFLVSCFEDGIYFGAVSAPGIGGVANANICQFYCQALATCLGFLYYKDSQSCYRLLANTGQRYLDSNIVYGPKFCTGILY